MDTDEHRWELMMDGKEFWNEVGMHQDMIHGVNLYQERALKTAVYPEVGDNLVYPVLGLANEAGEVAGEMKKLMRDDGGELTPERADRILGELGDVLWYAAAVAAELGVTLGWVAAHNLEKLESRQARGKLQGEGGER
jgi:NTP pyrophosphatase (non-canonical NTP hydrolase)